MRKRKHASVRLWYRDRLSGSTAAACDLAEVSRPYVVVIVVDHAVTVAIGAAEGCYCGAKGVAPKGVVRRVNGAVLVVVAQDSRATSS